MTFRSTGVLLVMLLVGLGASEPQPRLLCGPAEIAALRERVTREPYAAMLAALRERAEQGEDWVLNAEDAESMRLYDSRLINWAAIYAATGEAAAAQQAADFTRGMIEDQRFWNNPESKGLTRAFGVRQVALAYDLCAPAWPAEFREVVADKLLEAAQGLARSMGEGENKRWGSNWQGVRWGAAGLAALALDGPEAEALAVLAHRRMFDHFRVNLEAAVWNPEGLGYTVYPWSFTGPFLIAARRAGLTDLAEPATLPLALRPVRQASVAVPTAAGSRGIWPDLSDDNFGYHSQGVSALAFALHDPAELPQWRWHFDALHAGVDWDGGRGGGLYGLLWYPADTPAQAPSVAGGFVDREQGLVIFRNAFEGADDMVVLVNATARRVRGAHGGADINALRLIGLGGAFIVGSGRTGDTAGQSTLFAGEPPARGDDQLGILAAVAIGEDGSGTAVIEGSCMGVRGHRRHLAVDYSRRSGAPLAMLVVDDSENGDRWRLNTPDANRVELLPNRAVITAPNGARLELTVLGPQPATLATGLFERGGVGSIGVRYQGHGVRNNRWIDIRGSGRFIIAMTLQPAGQPAPIAAMSEDAVQIGEAVFALPAP